MSKDFKQNIEENINSKTNKAVSEESKQETSLETKNGSVRPAIKRKSDDKKNKKSFNIYMDDSLVKELDKFAKKSGYSRNELINHACKYLVENFDITE